MRILWTKDFDKDGSGSLDQVDSDSFYVEKRCEIT